MNNDQNIIEWATDRNLIGPTGQATSETQLEKLREEVQEVADEVASGDRDKLKLEIGDCYVVLTLMSAMWGLSMDECIDAAWHKIKDRTGMMLQGKYVKQDNLDRLKDAGFTVYSGRLSKQVDSMDERDAAISVVNANGLRPASQWFSQLRKWEVSVS